jgi:thiosulfate dehydrogenase
MYIRHAAVLLAAAAVLAACGGGGPADEPPTVVKAGFSWDTWTPPDINALPDDSLGRSIRRGRALMMYTKDSLPQYVHSGLTCTNCHLDEGRAETAAPLTGTFARFPKYMARTGAVITVEDRVNYCFTRSMSGLKIPNESKEMTDMVNYLAFLSYGVPVGTKAKVDGLIDMPERLTGDSAAGAALFQEKCAVCHGQDGAGIATNPPLWGPMASSIGASMAREERAASFIWHNMPLGQGKSLTHQQAFDVAAFLVRQPRPDSPNKEKDWPNGGAPYDVPYRTAGHEPFVTPKVLPRKMVELADVPPPPPAPTVPGSRAR